MDPVRSMSLSRKMQTYNDEAEELLRLAEKDGVDIGDGAAFESWLRSNAPELVGMEAPSDEPKAGSSAWSTESDDPKELSPAGDAQAAPSPEDAMAALLDAFDHDVNVTEKKKLAKWLADNKSSAAPWIEKMGMTEFYGTLGGFFEGLGRMRSQAPKVMSSTLMEQDAPTGYPAASADPAPAPGSPMAAPAAPAVPSSPPTPAAKAAQAAPEAPPEEPAPAEEPPVEPSAEPPTEEMNAALMDAYLEGTDITRRAQLVKDLSKSGSTVQAETVSQLSLPGFYRLLSEFFKWVAQAMAESAGSVPDGSSGTKSEGKGVDVGADNVCSCMDESVWFSTGREDRIRCLTDSAGVGRRKAVAYSEWDWNELPDSIKKALSGEPSPEALSEMRSLAVGPLRLGRYVRQEKPPVAVLIESTTSPGVQGAPDVGVLDVGSYGGYLDRTLPYLIHSTLSRMDERDKGRFAAFYHQFVETNDIVRLTELSGRMADVVEYADATQEGAELVKTFRFMSDFLNMMRSSVDYTKKSMPAV